MTTRHRLSHINLAGNLNGQGSTQRPSRCSRRRWRSTADFLRPRSLHRRLLQQCGGQPPAQGKYAAAQPMFEKALEIHRRLFHDNHPATAV